MTAESFVEELQNQAPNIKQYVNRGLSENYIKRRLSMYKIDSKEFKLAYEDNLLELVANYNVSHLEIGMVTLKNQVDEDEDYYYVGNVEVDHLVKNKQSGIIEVLEFDQPSNVLWSCASNGALFLDALLVCESYLTRRTFDKDLLENEKVRAAIISECSEKAGGYDYIEFYEMLLG
jgi:hypothetical protein